MKYFLVLLFKFALALATGSKKCIIVIEYNIDEYIECSNVASFQDIATEWEQSWASLHIVNHRPDVQLTIAELTHNFKKSVTNLNLSKAGKVILTNRGFRDFSAVKSLNLSRTGLESLNSAWFSGLKLEVLDLSGNEIQSIDREDFRSLANLIELSLASNGFDSVKENLFSEMSQLLSLDLSLNSLQNVKDIGLIPHLKTLKINDNLITEISKSEFLHLPDLENLIISFNVINKIENQAFSQLPNIRRINLAGNTLDSIPVGLFVGMVNREIDELNLSENRIKYLENRCFEGLYALKQLDLSRNNLAELNEHSFTGLQSLKLLNLSNNVILNIQPNTFQILTHLEILELSGNRVQTLDGNVFGTGGMRLKKFNLARNDLLVLQPHLFEPIRNIDSFDASYNKLKYFDENLFQPLIKITKINFEHNLIDDIPAKIMNELRSLKDVSIGHNNLTFLRSTDNTFRKLRKVSIGGNPWQCLCLDGIINFLASKGVNYLHGLYFDGRKSVCVQTSVPYCIKDIQRIRDEHIVDLYTSST